MSRYYRAEDIEREIARLLRFRDENDFDLGTKHGIETLEKVLKDLPTIEVSEDCSDYYKGYCARYEDGCFHQCKYIPSVIPQPKEGEWQLVDHLWECDCCQYRQNKSKPTNYCPNCGARMKG